MSFVSSHTPLVVQSAVFSTEQPKSQTHRPAQQCGCATWQSDAEEQAAPASAAATSSVAASNTRKANGSVIASVPVLLPSAQSAGRLKPSVWGLKKGAKKIETRQNCNFPPKSLAVEAEGAKSATLPPGIVIKAQERRYPKIVVYRQTLRVGVFNSLRGGGFRSNGVKFGEKLQFCIVPVLMSFFFIQL